MNTALPGPLPLPLPLQERYGVDRSSFESLIAPLQQPVVLRGLVAHWPLVQAAGQSDLAVCQLLAQAAGAREVDALMVPPGQGGRIFYSDDWLGFNYLRNRLPLPRVLEQLLRYAHFADPPAVAVQSALLADTAPDLLAMHPMPLLDASVAPRLWLGNGVVTPTHFDESSNIACVAAGRRRFTLFPPDQVANLYVGSLGHAPTGTPISLVDMAAPDLLRYPRFAQAMAHARSAVLEPGDALFIPPLWWHHVVSLRPLNLLVNYWWTDVQAPSGLDALLHAHLAFGALPAAQRQAWMALLAHWVFDADAHTQAHVPPQISGLLGPLTPELRARVAALLQRNGSS